MVLCGIRGMSIRVVFARIFFVNREYCMVCAWCGVWWHDVCSGMTVCVIRRMRQRHGWACVRCVPGWYRTILVYNIKRFVV